MVLPRGALLAARAAALGPHSLSFFWPLTVQAFLWGCLATVWFRGVSVSGWRWDILTVGLCLALEAVALIVRLPTGVLLGALTALAALALTLRW